jgi:hypothetical protein
VRRPLGAVLGGAALAAAAGAGPAAAEQVVLPSAGRYPSQSPPLVVGGPSPRVELPFQIRIRAGARVLVGVGPDGHPVSVRVRHRLVMTGRGDYQVVVGAPATSLRGGPGSDSQPGLRTGQILWAGFSPGRKVLAVDATLRPVASAPFLPIRLRAQRDGERYALTVTNATELSQVAFTGTAKRAELAALLDDTRRQALAGLRLAQAFVSIDGPTRTRAVRIAAPLRVEGMLRFPAAPESVSGGTQDGRDVSFSATLGDGRPLSLRVNVRGGGIPLLRLVVRTAPPVRALTPPGSPSWSVAARRRGIPAPALLSRLETTRMQLVRGDQFDRFLENPDTQGPSRTVYVYATAAVPRPRVSAGSDSGGNALVIALAIAGSVVVAGAALVLWANS